MKPITKNVYDAYCPMLYSIALQLGASNIEAERILLLSFEKINRQQSEWMGKEPFCIGLMKLIVQTAQEALYPAVAEVHFNNGQFDNTSLLHKLLAEQLSLETYCSENNIDRNQALLSLRKELMEIRTAGYNEFLFQR